MLPVCPAPAFAVRPEPARIAPVPITTARLQPPANVPLHITLAMPRLPASRPVPVIQARPKPPTNPAKPPWHPPLRPCITRRSVQPVSSPATRAWLDQTASEADAGVEEIVVLSLDEEGESVPAEDTPAAASPAVSVDSDPAVNVSPPSGDDAATLRWRQHHGLDERPAAKRSWSTSEVTPTEDEAAAEDGGSDTESIGSIEMLYSSVWGALNGEETEEEGEWKSGAK